MQHRPNADEIEAVLNRIENKQWNVEDYTERSGKFETATLTIEVEYIPPQDRIIETGDGLESPKRQAKATVQALEEEYEEGAPIDEVVDTAADESPFTTEEIEGGIEDLRRRGEVYEPKQDHLRST